MALTYTHGSDSMSHGSASALDDIAAGTIACWVRPTSIASGQSTVLLGKTNAVTTGWSFQVACTDYFADDRALRFNLARSGTMYAVSADNLCDDDNNIWVFYAATWDTSSGDPVVYRGTLTSTVVDVTDTSSASSGSVVSDASDNLQFGAAGALVGFGGRCAWVGVWDKEMSLGEIKAQQFRPHVTSNCLIFTHHGTDGAVSAVTDWSGNDYVGNATGTLEAAAHVPVGSLWGSRSVPLYSVAAAAATPLPGEMHHIRRRR